MVFPIFHGLAESTSPLKQDVTALLFDAEKHLE